MPEATIRRYSGRIILSDHPEMSEWECYGYPPYLALIGGTLPMLDDAVLQAMTHVGTWDELRGQPIPLSAILRAESDRLGKCVRVRYWLSEKRPYGVEDEYDGIPTREYVGTLDARYRHWGNDFGEYIGTDDEIILRTPSYRALGQEILSQKGRWLSLEITFGETAP